MAAPVDRLLLQTGDRLLLQAGGSLLLQTSGGDFLPVRWRCGPYPRRWAARRYVRAWRAGRYPRVWRASAVAEFVDNQVPKTPGDSGFRYVMDLSELLRSLGTGITITSLTSVTVSPSGPTLSASQVDSGSKTCSVKIAGGTSGVDYDITFTGVLSSGETFERTGVLPVRTK